MKTITAALLAAAAVALASCASKTPPPAPTYGPAPGSYMAPTK